MSLKTKPSGVEWIGDIPEEWKIGKVKYCYNIILGKMLQPLQERSTDKEMNYMCSANVTWNGIDLSIQKQMWFSPAEIKQYLLQKGDLLVAEGGDVAISSIWNNELLNCCIQNALHLIRDNKKHSNIFLYYWLYFLKHSEYIDLICNKATIAHFTKDKFGESPICVIPLSEQQSIAAFLDEKCSSIDSIIADIEKQVEILQQYKTSLITETITKGLDKSAPMKDSGIDWIGKIPAHWKIKKIKYIAKLGPQCYPQKLAKDTIVTFLPMEYVKNGYYIDNSETLSGYNTSYNGFCDNDIIMAKVTPCFENGNIAICNNLVNGYGYGSSELFVIKTETCVTRYLFYFLQNETFKKKGISTITGVAGLKRISSDFIENYLLGLPPEKEQHDIASFLDEKCNRIDKIITEKQSSMETMKSYKKSLIYEYVTGKKRVKGG
jgi:type I restriction enzyme S subunit